MKNKSQPVKASPSGKRQGADPREIAQRLIGGATGGLAMSSAAAAQPAHCQSTELAAPSSESAEAPAVKWDSAVLDPHQVETLSALAERIVPGSTKAGVAPFVNLLLSADTLENQKAFLASLSALDGESRRRYGVPFKELAEARQNELLKIISTPAHGQSSGSETASPAESASQPLLPVSVLHDHFKSLKSWVSKAYYTTEIGLRELGWTDSYFWPTFPGCKGSGS